MKTKTWVFSLLPLVFILTFTEISSNYAFGTIPPSLMKTYFIHRINTKNQVLIYKVDGQLYQLLPLVTAKANMSEILKLKILKTNPDGSAIMTLQPMNIKIIYHGKVVFFQSKKPLIKYYINKNGVITKNSMTPKKSPNLYKLLEMIKTELPPQGISTPAKPVKIGDEWTSKAPYPFWKGNPIIITYKIVGMEVVDGTKVLLVKSKYNIPISYEFDKNGILTMNQENAVTTVNGYISVYAIIDIIPSNARMIKYDIQNKWDITVSKQGISTDNANTPIRQHEVTCVDLKGRLIKVEMTSQSSKKR